jgi:hypothetical protein
MGFEGVALSHAHHKPSVELYFEGAWVGLHCFWTRDGENFFDEEAARVLIRYVEAGIQS